MIIAIFFVLGLIVGSFLNVVVYRLEIAETIMGRSFCPHCRAKIRWYDNIPLVSFILLKARCRDCEGKISWQYPFLEGATGLVFALVGAYLFNLYDVQSWLETFFYLAIFSMFLVVFVYDFKFMEIPMIVIWLGVGLAVAYFLYFDFNYFQSLRGILSSRLFSGILGGAAGFLFFFLLVYFSKERWMGMGDAYLAFLIGLVVGWPKIFFALTLAFSIGAVFGLVLIALKHKTLKSQVPFGPFLVAGAFLTVMLVEVFPALRYLFFYYY